MELIKKTEEVHCLEEYALENGIQLNVGKIDGEIKSQAMKFENRFLYLVKAEFFDYIKTINPFHSMAFNDGGHYLWYDKYVIEDIINADIDYNNVIELRSFDHTLRPIDETIYSTVIATTLYEINNQDYDLEKVLEYLKTHEYVLNGEHLKIDEIPYYNAEDTLTHHINVSILLPQEVTNDVWEKAEQKAIDYKELVLGYRMSELNILGLNQFKLEKEEENAE